MQITTNEFSIVEKILANEYSCKNVWEIRKWLIKYYSTVEGMDKKEIRTKLHEYSELHEHGYIKDHWINKIDASIRKNFGLPLMLVDNVFIYTDELEVIKSVKDIKHQKVLFSFLVYSKINMKIKPETNGWVWQSSKDVFIDAGLKWTDKKREFLINEFVQNGLIKLCESNGKNSRVPTYLSQEGDIEFVIDNFDRIDIQYEQWLGLKVKPCEVCGDKIEITTSSKYCEKCSKEKQLESARNYKKKIRSGQ